MKRLVQVFELTEDTTEEVCVRTECLTLTETVQKFGRCEVLTSEGTQLRVWV